MNEKRKLKDDGKVMIYIIKLIFELKKSVLMYLFTGSIFQSVAPFIPIVLSAKILDELLGTQDVKKMSIYVVLLISLSLILNLLSAYNRGKIQIAIPELNQLYFLKMSQKSMTMDYEYVEQTKTHELRRLINEGNNMRGGLWDIVMTARNTLIAIFEIIISFGIILTLFTGSVIENLPKQYAFIQSFSFVLIVLGLIIVTTIINGIVHSKSGKLEYKFMIKFMPLNRIALYIHSKLSFDYEKGKDFRVYQAENMLFSRMKKLKEDTYDVIKKTHFIPKMKYSSVSTIASSLMIGVVYAFVILKAFIGAITIGSVMMQINAIQRFYNGISSFATYINHFRVGCLYFANSIKYFELPPIKYVGTLPIEKREDHEYDIEFKNVSFKYPGCDEYVLKNVSLSLKIGERLAVVGMNGAGKTTMIKLLCRLYDPTEGEILLNGVDIKKYDYNEYLSLFSVVFQDFTLYSFSIEENIAIDTNIDKDKLEKACIDAGLQERIEKMSKKTKTYVGKSFDEKGIDISGGEKQKIAIARALYKNASIIILDEPTAALDPIAEFEIYSKFDNLVGQKTAIYISHRLSSCRFCHDIIVFHEGELIQRGTHEQLLENSSGKYTELWEAQAKYYKKENIKI